MVRTKALARTLAIVFGAGMLVAADDSDVLIFGGSSHDVFLGCLSCNKFESDSVWNEFSKYGWHNSFGEWNPYGNYKNPYAATSACSAYASHPPVLVDRAGNFYGYLSVSEFKTNSVCGAGGSEQICTALKVMCGED